MNNDNILIYTRRILEIINSDNEVTGNDAIRIVESAFVNQIAGSIVGKTPTGDHKIDDQRHYQLVTIIADFVQCMKKRFMSDPQIKEISEGKVLKDIQLFSEKIMELDMDVTFMPGSDSTN